MNKKERDLIIWRVIDCWEKYKGHESDEIKKQLNNKFCNAFTVNPLIEPDYIVKLLVQSIKEKNEGDLELLLQISQCLDITVCIDEVIAPLLIEPWHHFHDNIASILESDANEKTIKYLYLGASYCCDNLDYQSDYCEFNRKCLYALSTIGTKEALDALKTIANGNGEFNKIVISDAKEILNTKL